MKRLVKKTKGIVKGVPSAVLLSALIHFILLTLAGTWIVFSVIKKPEKKFVPPPPVERPKMKLKKPKVKVKKTSAPPAARHIVSKTVQAMPELQLPDVSGIAGSGFGSGLGGFDLIPDVSEISPFGAEKSASVGNDFEGTMYVLNRSRDGKDLGSVTGDPVEQFIIIRQFLENNWSPNAFAEYYRSPKKLYATQFLVPIGPAIFGPRAFGVPCDSTRSFPSFVVHYKGKIRSQKGGTYRFWGCSAHILLVRIKGEVVLNASYWNWQKDVSDWRPTDEDHLQKYILSNTRMAAIGHWFTLKPGEVVEMEVLFGTMRPPRSGMELVIEDKAEAPYYSHKKLDDAPILPVFRTAEMSQAQKDELKYLIYSDSMDLDGGEIFNVH